MRETPLVWQVRHTETNAHWSHELKSLFLQRWGEEPFSDSPFCFLSWSSLWTTSSLSSSTWQHQEIKHTHLQTELKNIQKHQPGKYPQPGNLENYYKQIKQRRPHGVHVLQDRSGVYQSQINTPNKWHHLQFKGTVHIFWPDFLFHFLSLFSEQLNINTLPTVVTAMPHT